MTLNTKALIAIIAVNFVTISGFGFLFPIFAVYGKAIEANATEIALSIASFSLGNLIANPIWGKASDQFGRKRLLVISLAAGAVITALNVLAVTPWALIFARFIAGLAAGSFSIAFAVAADISTPENRTRVMGTVGAGFSLGFIMGPAIGGFVAGGDPGPEAFARVCYAGAALMLIGAVITQIFLPETRPEDDGSADTENAPQQVSRWAVLRDPVLGIIILLSLVSSIAMAKMEATFAIFADDVLSLSPFGIGLYFAAMGGIGVIGQAGAAVWCCSAGPPPEQKLPAVTGWAIAHRRRTANGIYGRCTLRHAALASMLCCISRMELQLPNTLANITLNKFNEK